MFIILSTGGLFILIRFYSRISAFLFVECFSRFVAINILFYQKNNPLKSPGWSVASLKIVDTLLIRAAVSF